MSSFNKLTYHIVFGTKQRKRTLTKDLQERLYEYMGGIIRAEKGATIAIGGTEDHVHVLAQLPPTLKLSQVIQQIKGSSSKWINDKIKPASKFEWQIGYGVFSVSYSGVEQVATYIQNQEEHHRERSFKDEYIKLLERHGIKFEMKYLF